MTADNVEQIKLLLKKTVFSGNAFINNVARLEQVSDQYSTAELLQMAEEDEEIYNLLGTLELLKEQIEEW